MATKEEILRSQGIGKAIRSGFKPFPGSGKALDRLAGLPYGLLAQIYGGAADITGGIGSSLGFDEFATNQYNRADDAYQAGMDKYTKGFGGSGGYSSLVTPQKPPSQIQQIKNQSSIPSQATLNSFTPSSANTPVIPQSLPTTSLLDGAYTQDQINEILSDLPKAPQALPDSSEMTQYKENMATDPKGGDKSLEGGKEAIEGLMNKSIMDYIDNIRGHSPEQAKTLEKYKEEFAEATGLDVSGKPDTKDALVAFGLALMQNKAGKGFNVGNMLKSVGSAGEKAMPLLQKAKAEAKAAGVSAGKYALEMKGADTAKAEAAKEKSMNRKDYYILPSDGSVSGTAASIMNSKGKRVKLNASELDALMKQEGFEKNYTVLAGSNFDSILKEVFSTKEAKDSFSTDKSTINLFNEKGVDGVFTFDVYNINPNLDPNDPNTPKIGKISGIDVNSVYKNLTNELDRIDKAEDQFADIISLVQGGAGTTPEMVADSFISFGRKLGFGAPPNAESMTDSDKIQFIVNKLSAQNAPEILGESGKTISDADRERVAQIVTEIKTLGGDDPSAVLAKMMDLKYYIVDKKRNEIYSAFEKFDGYSRQDTSAIWGQGNQENVGRFSTSSDLAELTPEMEKKRLALRKKFGLS